ncbi:MAG: 5-formyltetrahydrofolate cyclo-ligase [Steroidobacteraceae bacterium]
MTTPPLPADARVALRRELRSRRRAIQGKQRTLAAHRVARLIDRAMWLRPGRRIGLYLAMPEELDTAPLLEIARRRGCVIALPRIVGKRHGRMQFFQMNGSFERGAFGILESGGTRMLRARELDIVFMPLVGFDATGHRIGMGKGFYDRHFAHRIHFRQWRRPLLVGLAYDVQEVPSLPHANHDVPLDAIVTESTVRRMPRSPT